MFVIRNAAHGIGDAALERVLVLSAKMQGMIANDFQQQHRIAELTQHLATLSQQHPASYGSKVDVDVSKVLAANDVLVKQVFAFRCGSAPR